MFVLYKMSVADILDQNGQILSQLLPTTATLPYVFAQIYKDNATQTNLSAGQPLVLDQVNGAVIGDITVDNSAPIHGHIGTALNIATPGAYEVSYSVAFTPYSGQPSDYMMGLTLQIGHDYNNMTEQAYTIVGAVVPSTGTAPDPRYHTVSNTSLIFVPQTNYKIALCAQTIQGAWNPPNLDFASLYIKRIG